MTDIIGESKQNNFKTHPLVYFESLPANISSKDLFIERVKLCLGEQVTLPSYFPDLPNFEHVNHSEFNVHFEEFSELLKLPEEMYDSDMYTKYGELLSSIERIIYFYNGIRQHFGLPNHEIRGKRWSPKFIEVMTNNKQPT